MSAARSESQWPQAGAAGAAAGVLVFASLDSLVGSGSVLNRGARDAVRALAAERIDVVVLGLESSSEFELAEYLGVVALQTQDELGHWLQERRIPYWRTAAVGAVGAHSSLLEAVSLPFWLGAEDYPGQRGVVELPRGDASFVASRLL
ncbi:MAG TPA: hypothetical protein VLC09_16030, partial [Polyangiaceae bacterium]|nr:hypothetical protein [Polyangiaceae bacterium]